MAKPIIQIQNISHSFGKTQALKNVSLSIEEGSVFALLGPNGAGKTTLVRILATLLHPTRGTATIAGIDVLKHPEQIRPLIGLAGQFAAVDDFLTGRETLRMVGSLYHLDRRQTRQRADELLERLSLTDAANRLVRTYSGGMRKRLDIGATLIGQPKIIFLDEPTTGLDPRTRLEVWEIVKDLVKAGSTILLTTQYLEEADALANTIAVLDRGSIVAKGTSAELKNSLGRDIVEVTVAPGAREKAARVLAAVGKEKPLIDELTGHIRIHALRGSKTLIFVAHALSLARVKVEEIALHRPTLDEVFLSVTSKPTKTAKQSVKKGRR